MDLSRRRRALRALASGLALAVGLLLVVLWAGAAQAGEPPTAGSITVVVDAAPNDAQDFTFAGCQGATACGPFTLDDDANATRSDRTTSSGLAPGTYTITQTTVPNWVGPHGSAAVDTDHQSSVGRA